MADRQSRPTESGAINWTRATGQRAAFTMAEILLSLTIIGVVAAITLPSLTGNINERTWNTQRKALYARFSQAIALMPAMNTYGSPENFVTGGLAKVLKINNICDNDHLADCGITTNKITNIQGRALEMPKNLADLNQKNTSMLLDDRDTYSDGHYSINGSTYYGGVYSYDAENTPAVAFETQNGESILAFYNPSCQADMQETETYYIGKKVCANFVYDLNGSKGPNAVGKDIGVMTVLYPSDSVVVAPMPFLRNAGVNTSFGETSKACTALSREYRAANLPEMISLIYNENLTGTTDGIYWTTTRYDSQNAWSVSGTTVRAILTSVNVADWRYALCVKRD